MIPSFLFPKNDTTDVDIPLLADDEHEHLAAASDGPRIVPRRRSSSSNLWSSVKARISPNTRDIIYLVLTVLLNIALANYFSSLMAQRGTSIAWKGKLPTYSPVDGLYTHDERVSLGVLELSKYHGPPTHELDGLWESLYNVGISAIPDTDAARLANETDKLRMAPGHSIVQLHVFHVLECIDTVRKFFWPEYYPEAQRQRYIHIDGQRMDRIDYCLNVIRESLTCTGDVTPNLWKWDPKTKESSVQFGTTHTCSNFEEIREWARIHQVPPQMAHLIRKHGALPPFFPLQYPGSY